MPPFVISLLAAFAVKAAERAGSEFGLKLMAELGPMVSKETLGKLWDSMVAEAKEHLKNHPVDLNGMAQGTGADGGPRGPG